jgi:serine protease Do
MKVMFCIIVLLSAAAGVIISTALADTPPVAPVAAVADAVEKAAAPATKLDQVLAEADQKLRQGLLDLAKTYPQLARQYNNKTLEEVLKEPRPSDRRGLYVWVGYPGIGKAAPSGRPENAWQFMAIMESRVSPPAATDSTPSVSQPTGTNWKLSNSQQPMGMDISYVKLDVVGDFRVSASDPKLEAALQKLSDEVWEATLLSLDKLEVEAGGMPLHKLALNAKGFGQAEPAAVAAGKTAAAAPAAPRKLTDGELLDFRLVIQSAKNKVFPAVVYIKVLQESHESGQKISQEVSGSGVIISAKGEVLTNWHVVDKATEVRCLLYDGRAMNAKVVGSDKDTDLALIQLEVAADAAPLPFAVLGDSDAAQEGDFVMAMGAPWGLSRSISLGIISSARRYLPENSQYSLWLQTDASISPGNSGGPLVSTHGEVIGINTRGILFGGELGFAVPSATIRHIVAQIREAGQVEWSWTGLQLQPLRDFDRNQYFDGSEGLVAVEPAARGAAGQPHDKIITEGVIVAETDPDSPARRAGLQPRDRIVKVAGRPVTAVTEEDLPAVRRTLGLLPKHKLATFELVRGGATVTVDIEPREKGKVEGSELDCPRWDFTVREINQFDNPDLFFYRKSGVFVFGIKRPGNASQSGLQAQDIIVKIDGKDVATLDDVRKLHKEAIENLKTRHRMVLQVLRGGLSRQVVLDYMRDFEKE